MRSLKKILALVLSLAMIMSVTAFAGFADADKVDADYAEAVAVLNGMGVFKGYTDGTFKPQGEITRAEVAAIVYRIATADVEDEYVDLWVGTSNFTDVADSAWYAGYVGFCASNGYVLGYGDGTFRPNAVVKGTEVLAMILRVNGYDAEKEFSGLKWSDNVAKVAVQNNVLGDVKPGALAKAAPREMVAQLLFGALNADVVEYTLLNGYKSTGKTLGETMFDLEKNEGEEADKFGRPAYTWTYETGDEETVFASEPLASYTVATKNCDIMADADLEEGDKLDIYFNGEKDGKYEVKDNSSKYGAQGRLVEVYEDRLVVIDTYLAEVTKVKAEKVDSRGHKTDAYVEATVYVNADEDKDEDCIEEMYFETDEFAKGDIVLVTICDDKIASMELAESEVAELTKVTGNAKKIADIQKIVALDKEAVDVNVTADVEPEMTLGKVYNFFYDTYGNVIGAEELSTQYAVLDSVYRTTTAGDDEATGTIVFFDGDKAENIAIGELVDEQGRVFEADDFSTSKKNNAGHYYQVYTYNVDEEAYELADAEFNYAENGRFDNGKVYLNTYEEWLQISKSTEILLQFEDSPNGEYEAYVGYSELPSFYAFDISYVDFDGDNYVDMLYARAEKFSTRTVFIYDINAVTAATSEEEGKYIAEVEALELIDGELEEVTYDIAFYDDAADYEALWVADSVGLYDIREIEDDVWGVVTEYPTYGVDQVTTDGKRVYVGDEFYALDDSLIIKYEGTATEGDYDDDYSFDKLNDESIIFMQFDEDEEVLVVYDMWIELEVKFAEEYEGAKAKGDVYFGKTLADAIEVTVPAYMDLSKVRAIFRDDSVLNLTTRHFAWDAAADKHAEVSELEVTTEERVWADVVITLVEDAKHTSTWINVDAPASSANMAVEVEGNVITVTAEEADPTVMVNDLLAFLDLECDYASMIIYDNTPENVVTEGEVDFVNMYIVVTAEDAEYTKTYDLVLEVAAIEE